MSEQQPLGLSRGRRSPVDPCSEYRSALERIAGHFIELPDGTVKTYGGPFSTLDAIRREAMDALKEPGCPCVGTPDQEDCPHE